MFTRRKIIWNHCNVNFYITEFRQIHVYQWLASYLISLQIRKSWQKTMYACLKTATISRIFEQRDDFQKVIFNVFFQPGNLWWLFKRKIDITYYCNNNCKEKTWTRLYWYPLVDCWIGAHVGLCVFLQCLIKWIYIRNNTL